MTNEELLWVIGGLAALLLALLSYLLGSRGRGRANKTIALPPGAEALAPAFMDLRGQLDNVREQIEDLRRAGATAAGRQGQEDQAWQTLGRVEQSLTQLSQLPSLQHTLQEQVAGAMRDLATLRESDAEERQRRALEDAAYSRLQRLSAVMLGSSTSGAAGERMVQDVLSNLPPQWVVTNHPVNGQRVEFAVMLPDGLVMPIDSKVVAQSDLDELERATDDDTRTRLEGRVRSQVLARASEVHRYVDGRTTGFAVAAVPDAAYRLSGPILPRAYQEHRALLVPYSLLAPFVLMVYEQHLRVGAGDVDSQRLLAALAEASRHVSQALQALNGHLSDAITRMSNARETLSRELGAAAATLEQARTREESAAVRTADGRQESRSA